MAIRTVFRRARTAVHAARSGFLITLAASVAVVAPAAAQGPVAELNRRYADVEPERRSEAFLLPALAALEPAPIIVGRLESARLVPAGSAGWAAAESWSTADTQVAALEALRRVTDERRYTFAMVFAQPYGVANLTPETILSGMYTDLGDPPLIAAANHRYMPRLETLRLLVHVECSRLVSEGRHAEALDLLLRLAAFGRQMVDRAMFAEVVWGYETIIDALRRMRDVAYQDFRGDRVLGPDDIIDAIDRLSADAFLALERLRFPTGNRLASEQLVARVYERRGGVREDVFLGTMVRLSGGERPLRRFAGASRWLGTAEIQEDVFAAEAAINEIYTGWTGRWELDPFDPVLQLPFSIDLVESPERLAVVIEPLSIETEEGREVTGTEMFELRKLVEVERVGTRQSLGVMGRYYETDLFPPQVSSVRAQWLGGKLGADAYNASNRDVGRLPPMEFFVPVRDAYVADRLRDDPEPHRMEVFPGDGTNFGVTLFEDQFVLYSVGPNGAKDWAERVSQDRNALLGDYLIWPPVLGLHREHLIQTGQLD